MAKSKVTLIRPAAELSDQLYEAVAKFFDIRAELVLSSAVLSDSAFGGDNSVTGDRNVSAILVLEKAVKQLSQLQAALDDISAGIAQPHALERLAIEGKAVANG